MYQNENGVNVGLASELKNLILNGYQTVKGKSSNAHSEYNKEFTIDCGDYKIFFNKCYTFWVMSVYDNGLRVRMNMPWFPAESQLLDRRFIGDRWCNATIENAIALIIGSIDDYEWKKLGAENEFIGNEMNALENTIDENVEKAKTAMDDAKQLIDGMNDVDWWDRDDDALKNEIAGYCRTIAESLTAIAQARADFLKKCSDFTGCDFVLGDAYSDCPVIAFNHYYDELDQFDCTLAFEQILDDIFENGSDEMLDLRDTLYHYLMVA